MLIGVQLLSNVVAVCFFYLKTFILPSGMEKKESQ